MSERQWLIPSVVLTLGCGGVAIFAIPGHVGLAAALTIYPAWIVAAAVIGALCLLVRMARSQVAHPLRELRRMAVEERGRLLFVGLIVLLSGFNMVTFLALKPLLNYLIPF